MDDLERRLTEYYDQEGDARFREVIDERRVAARQRFIDLLRAEQRTHLLEVGSGPGRDAVVFAAAGLRVSAVDRSGGHARLAADRGISTIQASVLALPVRDAAFDAGWTMSTLVHVSNDRWDRAMASLTGALCPGAPVCIGLWGGFDFEGWLPGRDARPSRFFSLRSHARARAMLTRHGVVASFETWSDDRSDWEYQLAVVRVGPTDPTG